MWTKIRGNVFLYGCLLEVHCYICMNTYKYVHSDNLVTQITFQPHAHTQTYSSGAQIRQANWFLMLYSGTEMVDISLIQRLRGCRHTHTKH